MRRFTKVALLLAAMSVLACSAAFAAYPLKDLPGNLAAPTDVHLISQDVGTFENTSGDLLVSQDKTAELGFLTLDAFVSNSGTAITLSNKYGSFASFDNPAPGLSFDKMLVRSITYPVDMKLVVSTDKSDALTFSLRGKAEKKLAANKRIPNDNWTAEDCTIACNNFYYYMDHNKLSSADSKAERTSTSTINWTGTDDSEFYVECCDYLGFVATSSDIEKNKTFATDSYTESRDMVIAHLSETPFLRVRVADEYNINDKASHDFRAAYWKTAHFNTKGAVDVPEGETYNMGVVYPISGDCTNCAGVVCDTSDHILPYVAVTNLGTESVYIEENLTKTDKLVLVDDKKVESNLSWLCNVWCGLCEYDDMMSGDKGGLGAGSAALIAKQSAIWDCACHIFPAFTNTWKGAGNMDFNYRAYKAEGSDVVTKITGRVNTSWFGQELSNSGLCDSCSQTGLWIYYPCECPEELYVKALGYADLTFAEDKDDDRDVDLEKFNQDAAADEYAAVEMVVSIGKKGLVASPDFVAKKDANIVLTKLKWTVKAASLSDAGLLNLSDGQWWRTEMWNKMDIKLNGMKLDAANVTSVGTNDMTPAELSFLTVVDGPQRDLTATTDVDVSLYVFVVDSVDPAVKYYKTSKGNRFLVVYDGELDGKFSLKGTIVKAAGGDVPAPVEFGVAPGKTELNIAVEDEKATDITAKNVLAGAEVLWSVSSSDIVSLDKTVGLVVKATGLKVGSAVITAVVSGDEAKSADVTITVKDEAPAPVGDSSGGGCNVGFAPAMLLLLAPLGFLKK